MSRGVVDKSVKIAARGGGQGQRRQRLRRGGLFARVVRALSARRAVALGGARKPSGGVKGRGAGGQQVQGARPELDDAFYTQVGLAAERAALLVVQVGSDND